MSFAVVLRNAYSVKWIRLLQAIRFALPRRADCAEKGDRERCTVLCGISLLACFYHPTTRVLNSGAGRASASASVNNSVPNYIAWQIANIFTPLWTWDLGSNASSKRGWFSPPYRPFSVYQCASTIAPLGSGLMRRRAGWSRFFILQNFRRDVVNALIDMWDWGFFMSSFPTLCDTK